MNYIIYYLLKFLGIFKAAGLKEDEEKQMATDVIQILVYIVAVVLIIWGLCGLI